MTGLLEYGLLVMGIAIGGGVGWLMAKQTMSGRIIRAEERLKANEEAAESNEQRIRAEVENIAMKVGEENSARFLELAEAKLSLSKKMPNTTWKLENWRWPISSNRFRKRWRK